MNAEHFDLYTDYLISSLGPTTATGLSSLLDGQLSHDQVTRLLASAPISTGDTCRVAPSRRTCGTTSVYGSKTTTSFTPCER
ncbi:MAG: hypothetical protein HYR56_04885 [Acidobacteria bacterium]|nr:hypothetical protein [Acidobacteriota bacterium]